MELQYFSMLSRIYSTPWGSSSVIIREIIVIYIFKGVRNTTMQALNIKVTIGHFLGFQFGGNN
jgi:hypothetical protein